MKILLAKTDKNIKKCFPVITQLRSHLLKEEFLNKVKNQQKEGYKLVYLEDNKEIIAVAGFRIFEKLLYGKTMYIDDLVTDANKRSKGYGDKLFDWLVEFAKQEKCREFQLDSGVQFFDAHRFYLRKKMNITAHHFGLKLN